MNQLPSPTLLEREGVAERRPSVGQWALVQRLLNPEENRNVGQASIKPHIYTSTEHYELEQQKIFRRVPIPLMPSAAIREPGTALAHSDYGIPLLVTRDKAGEVRVLLNACRHRGAKLVGSSEPVATPMITCPYHAWSFRLDGTLAGVLKPASFSCLDKADHGLIPFPAVEAGGMIWVGLDPDNPPDFSSVTGELADDFRALGFPEAHIYARRLHPVRANWKLILDAFQEIYHVQVLHAKTVAGMFADSITVEDSVGDHTRFATARKKFQSLRGEGMDHLRKMFTFSYLAFPNTNVTVSPTYINILIAYPQSVDETIVEDFMIIPRLPQNDEEADHWRRSWELLDDGVFRAEDFHAAALVQAGLRGDIMKDLVLGGYELPIKTFHDNLDRHLRA